MAGIQLQVRMLDGFSIKSRSCSRAYHIRAHKNWLLIAYLFLNRDRAVPRSELIALFQDSASSTDPSRMLRNRLFRIRKYRGNDQWCADERYGVGRYLLVKLGRPF